MTPASTSRQLWECHVVINMPIYVLTLLGTRLLTSNVLATQMEMFPFIVAFYNMNLDIKFNIYYSLFKYRPTGSSLGNLYAYT